MDWLINEDEGNKPIMLAPWKVLVVDDDREVFLVTKLALGNFEFEGRKLEFIYADSAAAAKVIFADHNDIAMALVDVVMESDDAGLRLVEFIRESLDNHYTRIVLRTGQPGFAPENQIVQSYDIDGYKSKTELTQQSLTHCFYTALRSYRDLIRIQNFQYGLEALVESLQTLQSLANFDALTNSLLLQIRSVLSAYDSEFVIKLKSLEGCFAADQTIKRFNATDPINQKHYQSVIHDCIERKEDIFSEEYYAHYCTVGECESVFLLVGVQHLNKYSHRLINLFSANVCVLLERLSNE